MCLSLVDVNLKHELSLVLKQTKSTGVYYSLKSNYHTNAGIIIEIPDTMLHKLNIASGKQKCSRAATIREAIDAFLAPNIQTSDLNQSLDLWKNKVSDGLSYQENLRKEWPSQ